MKSPKKFKRSPGHEDLKVSGLGLMPLKQDSLKTFGFSPLGTVWPELLDHRLGSPAYYGRGVHDIKIKYRVQKRDLGKLSFCQKFNRRL